MSQFTKEERERIRYWIQQGRKKKYVNSTTSKRKSAAMKASWAKRHKILNEKTLEEQLANPKTLMGVDKVPVLSVVPPASIIAQALAMRYGAYFAQRADGTKGYGSYNWRDQPIEAHIYIDAAMRHLMQWWDGEDYEVVMADDPTGASISGIPIDQVPHLGFAIATIGILIDAYHNGTLIDDRPKVNKYAAGRLLAEHKLRSRR